MENIKTFTAKFAGCHGDVFTFVDIRDTRGNLVQPLLTVKLGLEDFANQHSFLFTIFQSKNQLIEFEAELDELAGEDKVSNLKNIHLIEQPKSTKGLSILSNAVAKVLSRLKDRRVKLGLERKRQAHLISQMTIAEFSQMCEELDLNPGEILEYGDNFVALLGKSVEIDIENMREALGMIILKLPNRLIEPLYHILNSLDKN